MKKVDGVLRMLTGVDVVFGGKIMVFVGDHAQLPCVGSTTFIGSELYRELGDVETVVLSRGVDSRLSESYATMLEYLRVSRSGVELTEFVNGLVGMSSSWFSDAITLAYRNADVDVVNKKCVKEYEGELIGGTHVASGIAGNKAYKVGMPIMLTRNLSGTNYNGKIVKMIRYDGNVLEYSCNDDSGSNDGGTRINKVYTEKRYPTEWTPAFACTIHKSQGQTYKNVNIIFRKSDFSCADATALLYVALSRVRDIHNVYLCEMSGNGK
jgi:ATP-dependent exoDNAse (exonuclease V) alpha subunit